jgi:hypothetical protein
MMANVSTSVIIDLIDETTVIADSILSMMNFIIGGRQAIKSNRQTRSNNREIGHVNTETRDLCVGLNSQ